MRIATLLLLFLTTNLFAQTKDVVFQDSYQCIEQENLGHSRDFIFQYDILGTDSIVMEVYLSSGIKEGTLKNVKIFTDEYEYLLELFDLESNETVVENTSQYSYTDHEYQTITDPGGLETIVQPDGSHQTVSRPSTTQTVWTPVEKTSTTTSNKIVRIHKFKSSLNGAAIEDIINSNTFTYEIEFEFQKLELIPSRKDKNDLFYYLKN